MQLGWEPISSEDAMVQALSWLVTSDHISPSLRATIHLDDKIYQFRNHQTV